MPTIGQVNSSAHYLGHQHDSKPETPADRVMSKRHLKHRAEVEKMSEKTAKEKAKKLKKSIKYNFSHAQEHIKAMKDRRKELVKMRVKVAS